MQAEIIVVSVIVIISNNDSNYRSNCEQTLAPCLAGSGTLQLIGS